MSNEIVKIERPLSAVEVRAQVQLIQEVMKSVMVGPGKDEKGNAVPGVHYGTVPGCGNKPTLFKAGAEKIMATFRLSAEPIVEDLSTTDCCRYRVTVRLLAKDGSFCGSGIGECSTDEKKYKWRAAVCDEEFNETPENRRQSEWRKGWNGGKPNQVKQVRTQPSDLANTVLKMAKKRALVDAVLTATAASDIFDQDLEDLPEELIQGNHVSDKPAPQKPQPKATPQPAQEPTTTSTDSDFAEDVVSELEGVTETTYLPVGQAMLANDGTTVNIVGRLTAVKTGKAGKNKDDLTRYTITDTKNEIAVAVWGVPIDAAIGDELFFIGCGVSTYKGTKSFFAKQVQK